METINALRVELAERLEELPAALHSSFPDLGVDFLHHVFSDVLDRDSVPNDGGDGEDGDDGDVEDDGDDNGTFGRLRRSRNAQSARGRAERTHQATPRSSKRLRSLSNTTVGENSDSGDDATTAPESLEKDSEQLKEVFERALEHIDRIKVESARLEEAALSVGARTLVNMGPIDLVRCVACGKTVASHAMHAHTSHCLALRRETDAQTTTSGGAYTNDTASEMNGRARSTTLAIKSNIAPIKTRGDPGEKRGGMPLSPVAISLAAQSARQMRSFQGVPNLKLDLIDLPSPRSQYEPM